MIEANTLTLVVHFFYLGKLVLNKLLKKDAVSVLSSLYKYLCIDDRLTF